MECENGIQSNTNLFRGTLTGSIGCKVQFKRALNQYRSEAMDATFDLDSLIAAVEGNCSWIEESMAAAN